MFRMTDRGSRMNEWAVPGVSSAILPAVGLTFIPRRSVAAATPWYDVMNSDAARYAHMVQDMSEAYPWGGRWLVLLSLLVRGFPLPIAHAGVEFARPVRSLSVESEGAIAVWEDWSSSSARASSWVNRQEFRTRRLMELDELDD